jgi:hypothetical protein
VRTAGLASWVLAAWLVPRPALATLREDTASVVELLTTVGATNPAQTVEFLEGGKLAAMGRSQAQGCTVFVGLATRNNTFAGAVTRVGDLEDAASELAAGRALASDNGLLVTRVCDSDEGDHTLVLRLSSPRGAVAVVAASVPADLDLDAVEISLRRELGRDDGPDAPRDGVSPPLVPTPFAKRRATAAERARARGATNVVSSSTTADRAGEGQIELVLTPGCHGLRVMSKSDGRGRDIDVELSEQFGGAPSAGGEPSPPHRDGSRRWRDRSDLPDGHLSVCVAVRRTFQLAFRGAPSGDTVIVDDAISPLPAGVPEDFGARPTEEIAELFFSRETPGPTVKPIVESLGAQGTSWLGFEAEPGRCYLGTVALLRGASRGMRLSMGSGPRPSVVEVSPGTDLPLAHVCADDERVPVRVDVPGGGVTWVFLAWLLGAEPMEAP